MNKHIVIISRGWNDAEISVDVTDFGVGVSMPLDAFIDATVQAAGNPALLLTQAQLRTRIQKASTAVCEAMKAHTAKVM